MSIQSQKKTMKEIAALLRYDLGYIFGDRESGPNGAKKQFLTKSAAFLRALGKDLGFTEMRVNTNPAGIAVSGDVSLYGIWNASGGVYLQINQPIRPFNSFLFRTIRHIKDYTGGGNQYISAGIFENQEYEHLCSVLLRLKKSEVLHDAA